MVSAESRKAACWMSWELLACRSDFESRGAAGTQ